MLDGRKGKKYDNNTVIRENFFSLVICLLSEK